MRMLVLLTVIFTCAVTTWARENQSLSFYFSTTTSGGLKNISTKTSEGQKVFSTNTSEGPKVFPNKTSERQKVFSTNTAEGPKVFSTNTSERQKVFSTNTTEGQKVFSTNRSEGPRVLSTNMSGEQKAFFTKTSKGQKNFSAKTSEGQKVCGSNEDCDRHIHHTTSLPTTSSTFPWQSYSQRLRQSDQTPGACEIPKYTTDSRITCKLYPHKLRCTQICVFGYTFQEGVMREMKCKFAENVWKPVTTFEKCKPIADCSVNLLPSGYSKCWRNSIDKPPICEISCEHYEDKPAVPKQMYQCDINGTWTPALPFCALPGEGTSLVPSSPTELELRRIKL